MKRQPIPWAPRRSPSQWSSSLRTGMPLILKLVCTTSSLQTVLSRRVVEEMKKQGQTGVILVKGGDEVNFSLLILPHISSPILSLLSSRQPAIAQTTSPSSARRATSTGNDLLLFVFPPLHHLAILSLAYYSRPPGSLASLRQAVQALSTLRAARHTSSSRASQRHTACGWATYGSALCTNLLESA